MQVWYPLLSLNLLCGVPATANAETSEEIDAWMAQLAGLNRPVFAEPAGSHGSTGLAMGAGTSRHQPPTPSRLGRTELHRDSDEVPDIPRIWLTKGLPWPVDLLFTGGQGPDQRFTQASLGVQWNAFERLALPTVALRVSRGRIFGFEASEADTQGVEVATSFSPLPVLTIFAAAGIYRHEIGLHLRSDSDTAFLLGAKDTPHDDRRVWNERGFSWGVRMMPLPPFFALTAELLYTENRTVGGAFKLSFGL